MQITPSVIFFTVGVKYILLTLTIYFLLETFHNRCSDNCVALVRPKMMSRKISRNGKTCSHGMTRPAANQFELRCLLMLRPLSFI
jgi:hypothetical protein